MPFWNYLSPHFQSAGAIPPEPCAFSYGVQNANSPFRSGDYIAKWRAIEKGYQVQPSDCPPIRLISRFGWLIRCPGLVIVRRLSEAVKFREIGSTFSRFGIVEVGGDPWPDSDSGYVASWIAGSEYVKVQCGIRIYYEMDYLLYQGPLPNASLIEGEHPTVMAGLEYYNQERSIQHAGRSFGVADINIIVRLPDELKERRISKGSPLAWAYLVPKHETQRLTRLERILETKE